MMPDKYQNETDYREIPREYLDTNIPQGRGKIKWMPFASIPEQYERLQSFVEEQNKTAKPELSGDQHALLNENLHVKIMSNEPATIEFWKDGYFHKVYGTIRKIDMLENTLLINTDDNETDIQISMINITQIW